MRASDYLPTGLYGSPSSNGGNVPLLDGTVITKVAEGQGVIRVEHNGNTIGFISTQTKKIGLGIRGNRSELRDMLCWRFPDSEKWVCHYKGTRATLSEVVAVLILEWATREDV